MSITRSDDYIISLIKELLKQPNETEWLEFKHNNDDKEMIGEDISALSNSAALNGKTNAYMIWGVDDATHKVLGTTFTSLRERFAIDKKNISMVSKIINETLKEEKIYIYDESVGTKARKYIPWWAK